MLQHIPNMRQALRFTMSDFKGNELPGFCLPKKVRLSIKCLTASLLHVSLLACIVIMESCDFIGHMIGLLVDLFSAI